MGRKEAINILERFLINSRDRFTEEEYKELLKLIEEEDGEQLTSWAKEKWDDSASNPYGNREELSYIFSKIKDHIQRKEQEQVADRSKKVSLWAVVQRVAAILFFPILLFSGYLMWDLKSERENKMFAEIKEYTAAHPFKTSQEYISPAGTRSKVVLKDSTVVWLNSSSSLLVADGYGKRFRRVKLSGQAYFDVKKNRQVPFIVDITNDVNLTVTGTTFSVAAYDESKTIETVLVSGTVFLNHYGEVVKMEPSQKVTVSKDNEALLVEKVVDESYKKWKDGVLIFNETPMPDVITTLEKWFNVSIDVKSREIYSYKFTAKLDNCSLEQVMMYLSISSPITYSIKERDVEIKVKK